MKLSISLSDEDLAVLDAYVERARLPSRSAAVQRAIAMLRYPNLEEEYRSAWSEWDDAAWESTGSDGFGDAAR
jgi:Arc/MetJ-type ribon-helix-helix transcriptional regulator